MPTDVADPLELVRQIAREAARIATSHYGQVSRLTKTHVAAEAEAVTIADRQVQAFIVGELRKHFPGDGVIGEEDEQGAGITFDVGDPMGRVWVVDPIDGTNNFIAGMDNFCVSIGLLDRGMPVLGVVHDVSRDRAYSAAAGRGAFVDDRPAKAVERGLDAASMVLLTGTLTPSGSRELPRWGRLMFEDTPWKPRILGSAALECALVGAGVASVAVQTRCKLWDVAAGAAVVAEAGGTITLLDGSPIFPFDLRGYHGGRVPFLAGGAAAHPQFLRFMRENP